VRSLEGKEERRLRYVAISPVFAHAGSHGRKKFELNSCRMNCRVTDVLLFGPTKCGGGVKLKYIWYAANPADEQWTAKAASIEETLNVKGLLNSFSACERVALHRFISSNYNVDQDIWVTELVNFETVSHELTLEVGEGVPNSSLLWPFIKIPEGKVPRWLDRLCRP
jgi:hypothetical protein